MKTYKQMERHFKGISNHYRIQILELVSKNESITLDKITRKIGANTKTISSHSTKLVQAGLLNKKYNGLSVEHTLSPYGRFFIKFIKNFKKK